MAKKYKVIWTPQPKQAKALSCPAQELFFGGAAGGGKSDFLLADFFCPYAFEAFPLKNIVLNFF